MGKVTDVDILTTELGCKVRKLPYIYLRLPLGASYGSEVVWDVVEVKCGKEGEGWHPCEVSGGYGIDVWKVIRKGWDLFFRRTSLEVDNGRRVKFWIDKWCGKEPLCLSFPSLYALVVSKEA
ncbi:hypothetical protein CK203_112457 [Vitis vinifera]|uniref:Reverse transcriptase zinc-binding domain-containing protein n=1 Tax=Vitis vinifera TaxID=29760 RepID=A0A438CWY0_VITVI|nr:hypothetical protein CK203_112457 [Vitis vinifera]